MVKKQVWILFFVLGLLCLFLACLSVNYDLDFFARLIVGERFIEHGILPFKDFLSYTPTHPWFDHEWGSGVIFYLVLKYLGTGGILLLHSLLMFGTVIFIYKTQRLRTHAYPASLLFLSVFLILFAHINPNLIRCQMFTFFFFSIFLYLLEKHRQCGSKQLWIIPLITIIWNNLHGGVVSGLGIIFIYCICSIIEKKNWKQYLGVLCTSFVVLTINPYGINYLSFLFSAATMERKYIAEWWPFIASRHIMYYILPSIYCIFAFGTFLSSAIKSAKYDILKLTIVLITLIEGLLHVKLLSISLITSAALCYNEMSHMFLKFKNILRTLEKSSYAAIIAISLFIPLFSPQYPRANLYKFPLYEVEFLKINNIKGNIVVPFGVGSYVSYKLYPDNLIYMDGRYEEVYNNKEFLTLKDYELANKNWRDIINNYDTDILMPRKEYYIYDVLRNDKQWVHLFDGRICGIFIKKDKVKNNYIEPNYSLEHYKKTMFDGYFGKNRSNK